MNHIHCSYSYDSDELQEYGTEAAFELELSDHGSVLDLRDENEPSTDSDRDQPFNVPSSPATECTDRMDEGGIEIMCPV